ncbi:hypothetical protein LTR53_000441 [Teratosphaeriaceae sp. CCFEE 6253]|nr:hypothetical protein LTR53_000441 [Teratosphaeriaceae sp. CCFEE 6253]
MDDEQAADVWRPAGTPETDSIMTDPTQRDDDAPGPAATEGTPAEWATFDAAKVVRTLEQRADIVLTYYGGYQRPSKKIVKLRGPEEEFTQVKPVISVRKTYKEMDATIAQELTAMSDEIPRERFERNLKYLEDIRERPEECAKASRVPHSIWNSKPKRLLVVADNVYIVRALVHALHKAGLFRDDVETADIQKALRRMEALVAVMLGCVAEGSIWLTVMDALLEDFAQLLVGQVDARLHTVKMSNFKRLRKEWTMGGAEAATFPSTQHFDRAQIAELKVHDQARIIFGELARFYRGAVMLAYSAVSWGRCGNWPGKTISGWYASLIAWSNKCGSDECIEALQVFTGGRKTTREYGLAVGNFDSRVGHEAERTSIVGNRAYAYNCLYEIMYHTKWHPGYGPFFHYYAHLWHSACMPTRGKLDLIESVDVAFGRNARGTGKAA